MSKPQGLIQRALKIAPMLNVAGKSANATNDPAPNNRKNKDGGDWLFVSNTVADEVNSIIYMEHHLRDEWFGSGQL